ncbi:MAG TPA: hypothetical protein VIY07_17430, partial [Pseudolabrys sp.]
MNGQSRLLGDGGERILNTIKRNPEGLLLLAAGVVLMMRTNASKSSASPTDASGRRSGAQASERVKDAARQTMDTAQSYASSAAEAAQEAVDTARSYAASASDMARETVETARSYASSATQYAGQARRAVGEQSERVVTQTRSMAQGIVQNQPLAIAATGLAVGAALAAAFPPTQLERETLGPMGDRMSKAAERAGDQLKQATVKAGEKLKSAAGERGLDRDDLKDVAREVA